MSQKVFGDDNKTSYQTTKESRKMATDPERIAQLENEMTNIDRRITELRQEVGEMSDALQDACKDNVGMEGRIKEILNKLDEMNKRGIRFLDVALVIVGLFMTGISVFATLQNTAMAKVMSEVSKQLSLLK